MKGIHMAKSELQHIYGLIDQLSDTERLLIRQYLSSGITKDANKRSESFSDADVLKMITPKPKSGRDIVQSGLDSGAIGSWSDMEIDDSVEWLAQQRKSRFEW